MPLDYIDPRFAVPLIIVLWVIVVLMYRDRLFPKLPAFFANRRRIRRERQKSKLITGFIREWERDDARIVVPERIRSRARHSAHQ